MAGKTRWGLQPHLSNIVHLPLKDLRQIYPDYTDGTLKGKKSFWKAKIKKGEIPMPPPAHHEQEPHQGQLPETGRLKNTWEVAAYDREQGGWVTTTLSSYDHTPDPAELDPEVFVTQAQPVRIAPDRRKPVERDFHRYFDFPDMQLDFRDTPEGVVTTHNEAAMNAARMICRDARPDTIIVGGDNLDMAAFSRFDKDSTHFDAPDNLQRALDALHKYLALIRSDNPHARIAMLEGNHDIRLRRQILKTNSKIAGVRRANVEEPPVLSLRFLLHLDELGIEYYDGYPANEFRPEEDLTFIHGKEVRSNGSTAQMYSDKHYDSDVVFHHVHRHEAHTRTTRTGKVLTAITFGSLSATTGATSSYHNGVTESGLVVKKQENWVNAVGVIDSYPNGHRNFQAIYIRNGVANYNGKEYDGNE